MFYVNSVTHVDGGGCSIKLISSWSKQLILTKKKPTTVHYMSNLNVQKLADEHGEPFSS